MASRPGTRKVRGVISKKQLDINRADNLQRAGQNAYRVGDLQGALRSFTQALALNDENASILDNRAATYCKLKLYSQARTDARAMVKLTPNDHLGYLRLAKVLCEDGSFDKAREIYEYALQKLPADHSGRKVLTQLLKKLQDRLAGGTRRDPFTVLPLEIAILTLQGFPFKQIVAILRVCKGWNGFLNGLSSLWMHVDLTGARSRVPWTSVRNYIHRSRAQLTNATIANIVPSTTPKVLNMLSRCTALEHLELMIPHDQPKEFYLKVKSFRQLKSIVCGANISLSHACVGSILSTLSKLEKAVFFHVWDIPTGRPRPTSTWPQHLPNMKSLTIASRQENPQVLSFPDVIPGLGSSAYPNLEEFRLLCDPVRPRSYRFDPVQEEQHLPPLRTLELWGAAVLNTFYSILPTSLESLRLLSGSIDPPRVGNFMLPGDHGLPNLKTLVFHDTPWVNHSTLSMFLHHSKAPLRTLHVNLCHNIHSENFIRLLLDPEGANPGLKGLTEVGAAGMTGLDDGNVGKLWAVLPNVRILDLSQTRITGCAIRMFADARNDELPGPNLEGLVIKGCDGVSRDAIDYGRQKGLQIVT
ncbi:Tetratricopeptide-like helical [Penicillium concentricum]|uniref:Tetratricopeptide-like helical n=1 Tax=Penicillium concentricum TaxID=293559 RepID=A0A9W9USH5_9EURO|nr:Tetratricopeptide-like helical [Penicillium concentricum]KAJ5355707.1 Tetratricopeptide-like helical [Penicillium concentricum]